jgi:hypothetical protein
LLALVLGGSVFRLEFAQDDFWMIPIAATQLGGFLATPFEGAMPAVKPDSPVVQPTLSLLLAGMLALLPKPIAAAPFHALILLLHAASVCLLFRVLARRTDPKSAFLAVALFVLNPAGMQAWTWISAGGGVLALLCVVWAIDLIDRRGASGSAAWQAGVLAACALLSQRGGFAGSVLVMVVAWARLAQHDRRRQLVALGLPVIVASMLFVLSGGLAYIGGTRAGLGAVPALLSALPQLATDLFSGRLGAEGGAQALLPWDARWFLLPWILLGMAALPLAPRRTLAACIVLAIGALPAALHWSMLSATGSTASGSRSLYLASAALTPLVAIALASCAAHGGWRKRLAGCAFVLLGFGFADQFVVRVQDEVAVANELRSFRTQAETLLDRIPAAAPVLIADAEAVRHGLPLISAPFLADATRPPFLKAPLNVTGFADTEALLDDSQLRTHQGPMVLWSRQEGPPRILPALPSEPPALIASGVPEVWLPAKPLPGRAVAAIALSPRPMAPITGFRIKTEQGECLAFARECEAGREVVLGCGDALQVLAAEEISSITTHGADGAPPRLVATLPTLATDYVLEPQPLQAGSVPELVSRTKELAGSLRVEFRFKTGDYEFRATYGLAAQDQNTRNADPLRRALHQSTLQSTTQPGFCFESAAHLAARFLRPFGLTRIAVKWRVTLLANGSETPLARGPWHDTTLETDL